MGYRESCAWNRVPQRQDVVDDGAESGHKRIGQAMAARWHRLLFGPLLAAHMLGVARGTSALCAWGPPARRNCPPSRERPRPPPYR